MMEPALDEGSSNAAEQAAQHLADVLLPIDATTQLAALPELERHHTFVSACCERADVVLASALFRDLSQAFEKLAPLPRFSLYLALLQCAARDFRRKLGDVDASEERWLRAVAGCVAVVAYLRQGIAIAHDATTDALLTAIGDAELTAYREDITTFAASLYCVCVGLAWVAKPSYDDRIAEGLQLETPRDGRSVLLGRHEDRTAAESCVYDFAHALSGKGFALTKAEIKTPYVITHLVQCRQVRICDALVQPVQCCVCLEDTHRFDRAKFLPCYTCAAKLQKSACPTCAAHITEVVAYARHDELGPMRAALGGAEPVISWEAVIAHAHTLALEVQRLRAEVHTTTPGLKAAEARARSLPVKGATHLKFVIDGGAPVHRSRTRRASPWRTRSRCRSGRGARAARRRAWTRTNYDGETRSARATSSTLFKEDASATCACAPSWKPQLRSSCGARAARTRTTAPGSARRPTGKFCTTGGRAGNVLP